MPKAITLRNPSNKKSVSLNFPQAKPVSCACNSPQVGLSGWSKVENEMIVMIIFWRSSWRFFFFFWVHFLLEKVCTLGNKELKSQLYSNVCKQSLSLHLAHPLRYDLEPSIWPLWFMSFLDKLLLCRSPVKTSKRPFRLKCFSVHFHITHSSFPKASNWGSSSNLSHVFPTEAPLSMTELQTF